MEVTKENFDEAFAKFESILPRTHFASIDLEFTGIKGKPECCYDSLQERYQNMRHIATTFKIIQVGISLFIRQDGILECFPFNFYVFPEDPKSRIILEASAMHFLKDHNMDFNKWIYFGIPYMNEAQDKLEQEKAASQGPGEEMLNLNPKQAELIQKIKSGLHEWLQANEVPHYDITGLNPYLRKYFYDDIKLNYPNLMTQTIKENKTTVIRVHKSSSPEEAEEISEFINNEKKSNYLKSLGFRRVFLALTQQKLPLLLQNGLFDLMYFLHAFYKELPKTYEEFKAQVNELFPVIYDTRYLLLNLPGLMESFDLTDIQGRGLGQFYEFLTADFNPRKLAEGFERYEDSNFAHEAGYDALMTGICYYILELKGYDLGGLVNRLPAFRAFFTLNFAGEDHFDYEDFLYLKGPECKKKFAGSADFKYRFIKENECFVKAENPDLLNALREECSKNEWTLEPAEDYFKSKASPS